MVDSAQQMDVAGWEELSGRALASSVQYPGFDPQRCKREKSPQANGFCCFVLVFVVLGDHTQGMLGKCSIAEVHPQLQQIVFAKRAQVFERMKWHYTNKFNREG